MLRIGFISTWHVHTNDYARQVKESGKAQITAVWDENKEAGEAWAAENGVPFVENFDEFLRRADVDAVVCDSPTTMHLNLLTKAAQAGKHIFTEKLLTTSVADGKKLCDAVKAAGVIFTLSLPLRASAKFLYAKELVDNGTLGRVTGARMRRSHGGVTDKWLPERWFDESKTGGGALMDLGAHPVYVMTYLFGAPVRVASLMSNLYGTPADENAIVLGEFDGGILATMETAFVTNCVPDILEIYGEKGSLYIHGDDVKLVVKTASNPRGEVQKVKIPQEPDMPIVRFIDACLNKSDSPEGFGLDDGLLMTQVIEGAYRSNIYNTIIKL